MKRQLTFSQYRWIDLLMFAGMLLVFEYVIISAATRWFPAQPYTVSVVAAVTAIVMMRWGPYAVLHALLGGAVFCFFSGAEPKHYLIYCLGNAAGLLALLLIRLFGSERVRSDSLISLLFALCTQLFMQLGRGAVALVLGSSLASCLGFITTDALSGLFTMVIIWIVRRLDGLFENQKSYLLRLEKEREKERGETIS